MTLLLGFYSIVLLVNVSLYGVSIAAIFHIAPISLPLSIVCLTLLEIGAFIRTLVEGFRIYTFCGDYNENENDAPNPKYLFSAFHLEVVELAILQALDTVNLVPAIKDQLEF